jgi:transposase
MEEKNTSRTAPTGEVGLSNDKSRKLAKQIVLGIDGHLRSYQVGRKIDHGAISPAQSLSFEGMLLFAQKQLGLAEKVYAVYEAGPLGYVLYRRLRELGVQSYVCAPEATDNQTPKRKTNKIDARVLTSRLYSYVTGDQHALRLARVPTPEQEQARIESRQYDQLVKTRQGIAAQGRSLMLSQGYGSKGAWWRPKAWAQWQGILPEWMLEHLELWRSNLRLLDEQIVAAKKHLARQCQGPRPKGFGAQTLVQLDREILNWNLIKNRRQGACLAGMVPSEYSTGPTQRRGSITKVGVPRIRTLIIEMVWRLVMFQPNYKPIAKWREALTGTNKALKKKAAVAVGRQLLVDLWRMRTARVTAQQLGLVMIDTSQLPA